MKELLGMWLVIVSYILCYSDFFFDKILKDFTIYSIFYAFLGQRNNFLLWSYFYFLGQKGLGVFEVVFEGEESKVNEV